jgi:hypothetical protein
MAMNKKGGDTKYYLIIGLLIGIVVVGIVLFFFSEYFFGQNLDRESCRQSLLLRSGNAVNAVKEIQENFDFKCRTDVVTIDFVDYDRAGRLIADKMAECWYLFGQGKMNLYGGQWWGSKVYCFNCARIYFTSDVRDSYAVTKNNWNWNYYLGQLMNNTDITYGQYIYNLKKGESLGSNSFTNYDFAKDVSIDTVYDPKKGDLFLTIVYRNGGNILLADPGSYYSILVPHQMSQPLGCAKTETVPA